MITLEVTDNGRGIGTPARSSSVTSIRHRAEGNGRTLQLTTPPGGGTRLTWTAHASRSHEPSVSRVLRRAGGHDIHRYSARRRPVSDTKSGLRPSLVFLHERGRNLRAMG